MKLASLIATHRTPLPLAILGFMGWIVRADGEISVRERDHVLQVCKSLIHLDSITLFQILESIDHIDLGLSCAILRSVKDIEQRNLIFQMVVGVAVADGLVSISENHGIRLLADVLEISEEELPALYYSTAGKPLSLPGDPSSRAWWELMESRQSTKKEQGRTDRQSDTRSQSRSKRSQMSRTAALATLGLEEGASLDEIKSSYRRLAQVHHPDRFQALGEDAVKAATVTFVRINEAYAYLST